METWRRVEVAACEELPALLGADGPSEADLEAIRKATFTVEAVRPGLFCGSSRHWVVNRVVDEISYRRHHRYLTSVVDHRSGAIVWRSPGRNAETLQEFFDLLGERKDSIRAVSIDMSGGYEKAIRAAIPHAEAPSIHFTW